MAIGGFIGVNGVARKIKKIYYGVGNVARTVTKVYCGDYGPIADYPVAWLCWKRSDPYILYELGDTALRDGHTLRTWSPGITSIYSTGMQLEEYATGNTYGIIIQPQIDLTPYTTLRVTASSERDGVSVSIGVRKTEVASLALGWAAYVSFNSASKVEKTIDISSLTGDYTIGFSVRSVKMTVYDLRLE